MNPIVADLQAILATVSARLDLANFFQMRTIRHPSSSYFFFRFAAALGVFSGADFELPPRISAFSFFSLSYSSIHCSSVRLLTFGTFTVRSSQFAESPDQK